MDDSELLAEFDRDRSGSAFGEIVRRYTDLVYSAALRQMRNSDEAEQLTQAVFVILWQKASAISPDAPLAGWLLTATRFAAMNCRREKFRRAHHERKAAVMKPLMDQPPTGDTWEDAGTSRPSSTFGNPNCRIRVASFGGESSVPLKSHR